MIKDNIKDILHSIWFLEREREREKMSKVHTGNKQRQSDTKKKQYIASF